MFASMRKSILKCIWIYAADIKNSHFMDKNIGGIRVNEKSDIFTASFYKYANIRKTKNKGTLVFH